MRRGACVPFALTLNHIASEWTAIKYRTFPSIYNAINNNKNRKKIRSLRNRVRWNGRKIWIETLVGRSSYTHDSICMCTVAMRCVQFIIWLFALWFLFILCEWRTPRFWWILIYNKLFLIVLNGIELRLNVLIVNKRVVYRLHWNCTLTATNT